MASFSGALSIVVERSDSAVLLRMVGSLDLTTIGAVMASVDGIDVDRTTRLVVDLQGVEFVDAAGLHTMLRANSYCADHGVHMTIVKPRGSACRVFTLTRVHRNLDLVDSVAAANGSNRDGWLRRLAIGSGMTSSGRVQSPEEF